MKCSKVKQKVNRTKTLAVAKRTIKPAEDDPSKPMLSYLAGPKVILVFHPATFHRGDISTYIYDLTKLRTPAQILKSIALFNERMPDLLLQYVEMLNRIIESTFRYSIAEICVGHYGRWLDWDHELLVVAPCFN